MQKFSENEKQDLLNLKIYSILFYVENTMNSKINKINVPIQIVLTSK